MSNIASGYRLQALHLYNWGAFAGRHVAHIDADNTAIIGPTGSGKTTLIDALMTLLCASPRYNLASTGGHESDRDLVSYVRGASGPGQGAVDSTDSHSHLARSGGCVSAIAARLVRGTGNAGSATHGAQDKAPGSEPDCVLIGALFWFDGSSSSASDLSKRWFFAQGPEHTLDLWLEEHHHGGARALGKLEKATESLRIFPSKTAYLARLQSCFEVGPNAFTLLNRAAGLKQLNSIDDIFRELVLDDHSAFDAALDVAKGFDELATIHAELELANRQYLALLPLRAMAEREAQQSQRLSELRLLQAALPHWFAAQGARLWGERVAQLQATLEAQQRQMIAAANAQQQAREHEHTLLSAYLSAGGGDIASLEQLIDAQRKTLTHKQSNAKQYQALAQHLGLITTQQGATPLTTERLAQHQQQAAHQLQALEAQQAALQEATEAAVTRERNAHAELAQLRQELEAVRARPGSNVPTAFTQFRTALAEQLQLSPDELPFVAELVEVQKKQQAWRGAIERALGSHRLRILVPPHAMQDALAWVNQRHNHLHVRLLEVRELAQAAPSAVQFWGDGFAAKLNVKDHAYAGTLRQWLAEHDLHCVDNAEALRTTPHAMTQQGLMSGKARHFDKQDQRRIDQDWMTGFDNRDRLQQLEAHIRELAGQWDLLQKEKLLAQEKQALAAQKAHFLGQLQALRWDDLDVDGVQAELQRLQDRLHSLLAPQSDTAQAKARWEAARTATLQAEAALRTLQQQSATTQADHRQAEKQQASYAARCAEAPADAPVLTEEALRQLPQARPPLDCDQLDTQERKALAEVRQHLDTQSSQLTELHKDIIRQMARAHKEDRGALAEELQEVAALGAYLARLRTLEEEDLPPKRARFQDYLNAASDQGVSTLLSGIEAQVSEITERLDRLNDTLARVDFQPGHYLQLAPQAVIHPVLQELHKTMAQLRSERLRDDGGHSHYRALQTMVALLREHATNRRTKAAQALLDARYRLQFAVHVLDRATGQVLERRTGSQGGSGGEKEIIASYVLTASLSYALCPQGRSQPLFASIVLDEAFSKSSQAVAARIIQALREFGLHALFVTPNKELRLLRNHTRSAVLVHRLGRQATLASLRWHELDARAAQRQLAQQIGR
ncbi:ATP-binding protein [Rhodoferax sp.]|uniref:ATP-binding protein n=1 Tax=Rhodoferax sp. TaxID=50421 RepID=UPI002ACE4318|nr:ATP-binding protein [Rhodoferax sp.]MDZ7921418.1 ATP-binding protein [Rhodoferax sp.]